MAIKMTRVMRNATNFVKYVKMVTTVLSARSLCNVRGISCAADYCLVCLSSATKAVECMLEKPALILTCELCVAHFRAHRCTLPSAMA